MPKIINKNGRLAKKETDSGITAKYTYDDAGRMTEVNGVYSVRKFEYNENGDISHELLTMNIPGDFDGTILQYETDGMFTQLAELDNRATTADVTDTVDKVYNYSSDGELESIKLTNAQNGTQNCTGEYKYEDGRLTSYEYSFVNSAYKSYNANFTYDGNGRLTEADNETAYTSSVNDISYHTTVEYSANGTKSISVDEGRTTRDGSHEDYSTTKYEFDKNGLLTNTVTQYKADGEEDKEEYAHDVFGNLISISDKSGEDTISYKAVGYSESKPGVINEMIYDADDYDEYFKASYMPNLPAGNLNILDL